MLHNVWNLPRSDRDRQMRRHARSNVDSVDPRDVRLNPWLLWRPEQPAQRRVLSVAELAECTCPDLCNRDHVNE